MQLIAFVERIDSLPESQRKIAKHAHRQSSLIGFLPTTLKPPLSPPALATARNGIVDKTVEDWLTRDAMADCIIRKTWANWRWCADVSACATVL
jgi:hypothetical protein